MEKPQETASWPSFHGDFWTGWGYTQQCLIVWLSELGTNKNSSKHFHSMCSVPSIVLNLIYIHVSSFNLLNDSLRSLSLLSPFYRWENWGSERSSNLPKVIQLINGRARIQTQEALAPESMLWTIGCSLSAIQKTTNKCFSQTTLTSVCRKFTSRRNYTENLRVEYRCTSSQAMKTAQAYPTKPLSHSHLSSFFRPWPSVFSAS